MSAPLDETISPAVILGQSCRVLFTQLIRAGLRDVVVSPGSRNTPLVLEALRRKELTCHSVIDERSAGFFALGLSRSSGRTPLLLCTSGSAGAHYLPAVIEAHYSETALLVITADRPARLQNIGAPQTISQRGLFGEFAHMVPEWGEPRANDEYLLGMGRIARDSLVRAAGTPPGPVHINFRVDKPLEPAQPSNEAEHGFARKVDKLLASLADSEEAAVPPATSGVKEFFKDALLQGTRTLITVGPARASLFAQIKELAARAGVPCLSEFATCGRASPLEFLPDLWARGQAGGEPETILHFGMPCVSSAWANYLARFKGDYFVASGGLYREPSKTARRVLLGDLSNVISQCPDTVFNVPGRRDGHADLEATIREWPARVAAALETSARGLTRGISEPRALYALLGAAGSCQAEVVLGNSLPIRLASWVGPCIEVPPKDLLVARGANGIDGWLAAAAGSAAGSLRPTLAIVGDVTAAHDMGSLALCRSIKTPLVIAVIDNRGGRLFDHLPVRTAVPDEEYRFWRTEPEIDWKAACAAFGVAYSSCTSIEEAKAAAVAALRTEGTTLLHIPTEPETTVQFLRALRAETVS